MISKKDLIICFSLCFLIGTTGCVTIGKHKTDWPMPSEPVLKPVKLVRVWGGYFITTKNATNLVDNIDALKAYREKQKLLIDEMIRYYEK